MRVPRIKLASLVNSIGLDRGTRARDTRARSILSRSNDGRSSPRYREIPGRDSPGEEDSRSELDRPLYGYRDLYDRSTCGLYGRCDYFYPSVLRRRSHADALSPFARAYARLLYLSNGTLSASLSRY